MKACSTFYKELFTQEVHTYNNNEWKKKKNHNIQNLKLVLKYLKKKNGYSHFPLVLIEIDFAILFNFMFATFSCTAAKTIGLK